MRFVPLISLAFLALFAGQAQAVTQGTPSRDPDGLRRSVVFIENSGGELCSGAVIGQNLVLTAAHCMMDRASYRVVGVNRAFRPQSFTVAAVAIHPAFVPGTTPRTQPGVDLAILKLGRPLGPDFSPLDPRLGGRIDDGDAVTIAGFGVLTEKNKRTARTLRQTQLMSLGSVQVANRVQIVADPEKQAETPGAGACRGDSGGPILTGGQNGYRLYGIVSWSSGALRSRDGSACGGLTAVTPLAEHIRWVLQGMQLLGGAESAWTRR